MKHKFEELLNQYFQQIEKKKKKKGFKAFFCKPGNRIG